MRANIGKPVTRNRRELIIPQQGVLDRGRFKVLPITPRAAKPPGWRLGSGFDGITLEPSEMIRPRISRKQRFGPARTHRFPDHSISKLDFSTGQSSPRHFVGERGTQKRQKSHCGPEETSDLDPTSRLGTPVQLMGALEGGLAQRAAMIGGQAASEQAVDATAPMHPPNENCSSGAAFPSHHDGTVEEPTQVHQCQRRNLDAIQKIREPSKSERNGWLKRKRVHFAVAGEDEGRLSVLARTNLPSMEADKGGKVGEIAWTDI